MACMSWARSSAAFVKLPKWVGRIADEARMSARTYRIGRGFVLALALALFLPSSAQTARAQLVPGAQAPATRASVPDLARPTLPSAAAPAASATPAPQDAGPAPTAPMVAVSPGRGLCQCIADDNKLAFTCPGSPQACQSS